MVTLGPAPKRGEKKDAKPNFEEALLLDSLSDRNEVMPRPTRDETLMVVAHEIAKRGTCSRAKVGALISRNGRIIVTGYNGAPASMPHCDHRAWGRDFGAELDLDGCLKDPPAWVKAVWDRDDFDNLWEDGNLNYYSDGSSSVIVTSSDKIPGCTIAEHAERNAIAYAARYGQGTDGADLYCTHAPCVDCARAIINSGICRVLYRTPYRLTDGLDLLEKAGVEIVHMP